MYTLDGTDTQFTSKWTRSDIMKENTESNLIYEDYIWYLFFAEATGTINGLPFSYFVISFRIFYVTWYNIPDKGTVTLYRVLTIMNCTHIWNNKVRFLAKIVTMTCGK